MVQFLEGGSVTSTPGFLAAGAACGIKKTRKDLALIFSETPCAVAGTFTLNKVKAAPLIISQQLIRSGHTVRAVLVNSGNANACTGEKGYEHALECQSAAASRLGVHPDEILLSSTGVIGQFLPMEKVLPGIHAVAQRLSPYGGIDAAEAILTTDTYAKSFAMTVELSSRTVTLGAIAKGSGMIMPNMATMLAFLTTDAQIDPAQLQSLLAHAVHRSFNCMTVDGDTSTNDMVMLLANGISGCRIQPGSRDSETFLAALTELCQAIAKSIIADGEGATKLITVSVDGAATDRDAHVMAKSIANSPLVKTAIHGRDANWGRILCAAGYSGADFDPEKVSIFFDDEPILLSGYRIALDEEKALQVLSQRELTIRVLLDCGSFSARWWTCDLSPEYVRINAAYRT